MKTIGGIAIVLKKTGATPIRVYGTELAINDEAVVSVGPDVWKGRIVSVNRAGTVGRVNVMHVRNALDEQSEVEDKDVTTDDDLVAITITITNTPGSAGGMAVIDP